MFNRGELLTPYLYGKPQFEKPILFYWLIEASFKIFGVNESSARLPSALFGLLGIIATYFLGRLLFNANVGLFSSLILATSLEYIVLSRACVTDMALFSLTLFGVLFFFYGHIREKGYFYILSSASFALATLAKGPIAIILPLVAFGLYLLWSRDVAAIKKIPIATYVLVFIVIAAPWYLLMYKLHGRGFIDVFFGFHNVTRFLEAEHKIGSEFYYNIPVVLAGLAPWSVFLPIGFWHIFKKAQSSKLKAQSEKNNLIFILTWFLVIFIFYSVSRTKLPTYIFPSFISLALIVAVLWDDFLKGALSQSMRKAMNISNYLLFVIMIICAIGALIFINLDYPDILREALISAVFPIFGMAFSLIVFIKRRYLAAFFLIIYSVILFLYPIGKLILPKIEPYETSRQISQKLLTFIKGDQRVGSESHYLAGIAFYTNRIPVNLDKHHELVNFLKSEERVWSVLKEKNHIQL